MKKLFALLILLALPFSSLAGNYTEVNAEQLLEMKSQEDVVIIDSRGEKYMNGKIIEGAKILSVSDMTEEALQNISSKEGKIVFYCSNVDCPASAKAAAKAFEMGFKNLYKYPGGIEEWEEKGLPIQQI